MIAHAHDAVALIPLVGHGEDAPLSGDGPVKGRLEHAHPGHLGHELFKHADGLQIGAVVGRRHGVVVPHALKDLLGEQVDAVVAPGQDGLKPHGLDGVIGV